MDTKADYVTEEDTPVAASGSGIRPVMVNRIKQAMVTSRVTLAGQSTGADPYDTRRDRPRGLVWGGNRKR